VNHMGIQRITVEPGHELHHHLHSTMPPSEWRGSLSRHARSTLPESATSLGGSVKDNADHFGVPEENIRAAQQRASGSSHPSHRSTPTKRDIATLPPAELKTTLIAGMEHSAIEIVPSRAVLRLRSPGMSCANAGMQLN